MNGERENPCLECPRFKLNPQWMEEQEFVLASNFPHPSLSKAGPKLRTKKERNYCDQERVSYIPTSQYPYSIKST